MKNAFLNVTLASLAGLMNCVNSGPLDNLDNTTWIALDSIYRFESGLQRECLYLTFKDQEAILFSLNPIQARHQLSTIVHRHQKEMTLNSKWDYEIKQGDIISLVSSDIEIKLKDGGKLLWPKWAPSNDSITFVRHY